MPFLLHQHKTFITCSMLFARLWQSSAEGTETPASHLWPLVDLWGTAFTEVGEGRFRRGIRLIRDAMWVVVGTGTQYIPTGQLAQGCIMHRTYIFVLLARHAGLNPREAKIWSWLRLKLEFCPQRESAYWCSDRRYWPRDHQDMWQLWSLNHFEPKPLFQSWSTRCRCGVIYCANARGNFCCAKRASAVCCGPGLGCNWVSSPSGVADHCPKSGRFRTSPWI